MNKPLIPQLVAAHLRGLAHDAVNLDWGCDAQIDADNAFHALALPLLSSAASAVWPRFELKATVLDRVNYCLDDLQLERVQQLDTSR